MIRRGTPVDYPELSLLIGGEWRGRERRDILPVVDPATGNVIGELPVATATDLDDALDSAATAFARWRETSAYDRYGILRRAGELLRDRAEEIGRATTLEQGKPLRESTAEARAAADILDWFAEEGRRVYGRIVPSRTVGVRDLVLRKPVGPVAAFTPWNFPITIPARKVGAALAAGHLAAEGVKRVTLEFGGHAPVLVFDDADVVAVARQAVAVKFRNAGQICIAPTRFLVQEGVYEHFVAEFGEAIGGLRLGNGLAPRPRSAPLPTGDGRPRSKPWSEMPLIVAPGCSPAGRRWRPGILLGADLARRRRCRRARHERGAVRAASACRSVLRHGRRAAPRQRAAVRAGFLRVHLVEADRVRRSRAH